MTNIDHTHAAKQKLAAAKQRSESLERQRSTLLAQTQHAAQALSDAQSKTPHLEAVARTTEHKFSEAAAANLGRHVLRLAEVRIAFEEAQRWQIAELPKLSHQITECQHEIARLTGELFNGDFMNACAQYEAALNRAGAWRLADRVRALAGQAGETIGDCPALLDANKRLHLGSFVLTPHFGAAPLA
jgi:hypothetical protein